VNGAGVLDVTLWRQKDSLTVHLVNLTNPMMMKGPIREVIPLHGQKLRLKLPVGASAKRVQLLVANAEPVHQIRGGTLNVDLPPIGLHEVVAIDLA
jgi:hypothetical protein